MSIRRAIFKGGSHLVFGQVVGQVCSFIRNLVIARLINPADFGIAATFAMTLSLTEMISNVGSEMLLVQSPAGNDARLQGTAHFLKVGRGFLNAAVLFAIAIPMSRLFGVPEARWAFEWLAAFPLVSGFSHLDMYRVQRQMRFMPSVWVNAGSNLLVLVFSIPLAFRFRNYSVMLWALVLQAIFTTIASHLVSERQYRWAWEGEYARKIFKFGWPLLINGLLMYGIFEGDRLVIGSAGRIFSHSQFTLTDLGVYSVAFSLTMAPTLLVANVGSPLFLPVLSQVQGNKERFAERYLFVCQIIAILAISISIPFILAGAWAMELLYGSKYAGAASVIGWLAAMWGVRIFRVAATTAAISKGDTRNAMFSNIARSMAFLGMLAVSAVGLGLMWVPICGLAGEILASAVTVWRLKYREGVAPGLCLRPFLPFGIGMVIAGMIALKYGGSPGPLVAIPASLVLVIGAVSLIAVLFPSFRCEIFSLIRTSPRQMFPEHVAVLD